MRGRPGTVADSAVLSGSTHERRGTAEDGTVLRRRRHDAWAVVAVFAAVKLALHLVTIAVTPYSVHRDELLYLAMGKYLRFLAMDFPPFIAVAANAVRFVFGDTLFAIRILPALAGTAVLVVAALIVRELGGGRLAQAVALLPLLLSPLFLRSAALFQPVAFDQLWWTLALYAVLRIGGRGRGRDWALLGLAGGFGLLTKFSIGFIAAGIGAALLLTRQRRWLATPWPYAAVLLALLIGGASLVGQVRLGFPVVGQMADLQAAQLQRVTPASFLAGQALMLGPAILLAVWGLVWLLAAPAAAAWRTAGWACAIAFLLLLLLQGKAYYAGPIYPTLLAAGAVAVERLRRFSWHAAGATGLAMIAFGGLVLPVGLPILRPEAMARYAAWLGVTAAVRTNRGEVLPLPQDYADMLGWDEQVAAVAAAYHALPPGDRARAVVLASNYGEAGAIDFFGPRYGLPRAVSPAGSYWFFGPGRLPGEVAVALGIEPRDVEGFYSEYHEAARIPNPWGVPEQQDNVVAVLRGAASTLQDVWPSLAGRN
jgi:4-amino-4-deoxy-L-arabinose transferase-like glycosyltransferase